uniref:Dioxygenase n=1 Tax=Eutreptiella gymnastica TaxID=73025 RepID=A0A6U7ZC62_9EUGL
MPIEEVSQIGIDLPNIGVPVKQNDLFATSTQSNNTLRHGLVGVLAFAVFVVGVAFHRRQSSAAHQRLLPLDSVSTREVPVKDVNYIPAEQTRVGQFEVDEQIDFLLDDFKKGWQSQSNEFDYVFTEAMVEGQIPEDFPEGTLYRNGPGLLETPDGKAINQPFDGDGYVCAFKFGKNKTSFSSKFVRTEGYMKEQEAGRALYRGAFSTGNTTGSWFYNPFDMNFKNIANTGVVAWGDKLLALWEGGLPHSLDQDTLETRGIDRLGDVLPAKGEFAAHYRTIDGRFVNFGAKSSGTDLVLRIWEFGAGGFNVLDYTEHTVTGEPFAFVHDFLVSENYYLFYLNPIELDGKQFVTEYLFAKTSIAECLKMKPGKAGQWYLVPRGEAKARGEQPQRIGVPLGITQFIFHHANCYEEDGLIYADSVCLEGGMDFSANLDSVTRGYFRGSGYGGTGPWTGLFRHVLDPVKGTVRRYRLADRGCEFPQINNNYLGKPYRYVYAAASATRGPYFGPNMGIMKKDLLAPEGYQDFWKAPSARQYSGEPIFVPKVGAQEEDDGYVLSLMWDAEVNLSYLAILDAKNLQRGPVAKLMMPHHLGFGLHGSWKPATA